MLVMSNKSAASESLKATVLGLMGLLHLECIKNLLNFILCLQLLSRLFQVHLSQFVQQFM